MMKVANGNFLLIALFIITAGSCSVSKQINKQASQILLNDAVISTGHIGISIYDPAEDKYWYNYNATKYFVPASNTKLFSLYAGMKYLEDSLVGMRYTYYKEWPRTDSSKQMLIIFPSGDPTFLHPDFKNQYVYDFIKKDSEQFSSFCICDTTWKDKSLGYGWSWDDYNEDYMVERSSFPIFGNAVTIKLKNKEERKRLYAASSMDDGSYWNTNYFFIEPSYFDSTINRDINYQAPSYLIPVEDSSGKEIPVKIEIRRNKESNHFSIKDSKSVFTKATIPLHFETPNFFPSNFLVDSFKKYPFYVFANYRDSLGLHLTLSCPNCRLREIIIDTFKIIHSQPSDSLFTPMMHTSDNFFAEQTLLMASNERLGYMNDEAIIDTLLNTDLKDIPQRPQWVDGSGLSRYNLFTPQDFIYILKKLKNDFGFERVKKILPTGGTGTLKRYFNSDSSFIYAKTGTLSNQVALSGYLITRKNKLLLFSVLNNNYGGSTVAVRRAVEKFLQQIRNKY
jgi:D-alanyl-D-alanine carboxypeptidase/D-alanyl-D-alanine-endopeptidase (penicillin-binding protein 4)